MRITLVRHGESEGNTKVHDYSLAGDHRVNLTELGRDQAREVGKLLRSRMSVIDTDALVYCSPYARTRQTLSHMLEGAGLVDGLVPRIYEDPRLREVEHGYVQDVDDQDALRKVHGFFYYRYRGGESPADCYDRQCTFLDSVRRQIKRKNAKEVVIVSHGLTIRCFVMRYLKLTPEQFDTMANPKNCDVITIDLKENIANPVFTNGKWAVEGIRLRPKAG